MNEEKNQQPKGEIIIYRDPHGPEIQVKLEQDTVWLNQAQMAELFQKNIPTINEHIKNVYKEAELTQNSTVRKFRIVQKEGGRQVERDVNYYNLDVIISVGYRVKSKHGTQFRIWATRQLRDYLIKGYALNERRILENKIAKLKELETAHKLFQQVLESRRSEGYEQELLKMITDYADAWFILNLYDNQKLAIEDVSLKAGLGLDYDQVIKNIARFRARLMAQKQATDLFGVEVGHKLASILGGVDQTYGGKPLYKSIEERAAHLLYFVIKDHPFVDGNKRIGSLLFLLYLIQNRIFYNRRGERKINDTALVALALLIAESNPPQKDVMVKLVVNLINKR
jgi:prophage maintenance system killer protein